MANTTNDLHDRPSLVLLFVGFYFFPRESPCLPSTMFFMHYWFFGQSAGIELLRNLKTLIDADKVLDSSIRRPRSDGRTLPFLYKLSWGLEVNFEQCLIFQFWFFIDHVIVLSSEHGFNLCFSHLCSLLDPASPWCGQIRISKGVTVLPTEMLWILKSNFRRPWMYSWTSLCTASTR